MGKFSNSKSSGCLSFIGFASIMVLIIYLLFSNPAALLDGVLNILSFLIVFFLIIGGAIFIPRINFNKKESEIPFNSKNNKNSSKNVEIISQPKSNERNNQNPKKSYNSEIISNGEENLSDLRRNVILTDEEHDKKLEEIQNTNLEVLIKLTDDYKKLKSLFDNGVLTKDEFESKILVLKMMLKSTEQTKKTYSENEKEFTVTEEISEGYHVIMDDDFNYGFADINLDKIIDTTYEFADSFKEGLALVRLNDKFGFINSNNDIIISIKYDDAKSFEKGIAEVCNGGNWFFIDKIGQKH
jgi:hypothetical protein